MDKLVYNINELSLEQKEFKLNVDKTFDNFIGLVVAVGYIKEHDKNNESGTLELVSMDNAPVLLNHVNCDIILKYNAPIRLSTAAHQRLSVLYQQWKQK